MTIKQSIIQCGDNLFQWGEEVRKKFKEEIGSFRERLSFIHQYRDPASSQQEVELKTKLRLLLNQKAEY